MRRLVPIVAVATLAASTALASATSAPSRARTTSGTAWVSVTHREGNDLYVSGDFKDELLGRGTIVYVTRNRPSTDDLATVQVKARRVTIYTAKGSLTGTGRATQTTYPDATARIDNGTFALTKGTGAYRRHSLKGTFHGPLEGGVYTFRFRARYR